MAQNKIVNNPWSYNGQEFAPQTNWDTTYKSIQIVDKVVKTGEGDHDFVVVKDVLVEETPIKEVIEADFASVGIENIIKQVLRTGDTSLLPVDKGNDYVDVVGAPENLMELKAMGQKAEAKFNDLPDELTKGLDMKNFVESLTQDQFDAFIKAVAERTAGKVEDK